MRHGMGYNKPAKNPKKTDKWTHQIRWHTTNPTFEIIVPAA